MVSLSDVSTLQFRVETVVSRDGQRMARLRPDETGTYRGVPIAVLGTVTRNRTQYDIPSFSDQFTNPESMFRQRLELGQLYGEWGHPNLLGMANDMALNRLAFIDEERLSHHFRGIYTDKKAMSNGGVLLLADVKPYGPYKESMADNFLDPCMNTAFSLRAITEAVERGGVSYRYTRKLVTFDAVTAGGYLEASKLYSPSNTMSVESLGPNGAGLTGVDIEIPEDFSPAKFTQHSLENFTDTELNDLFGSKRVMVAKTVITFAKPKDGSPFHRFTRRQARELFHETIAE